jgi:iron complex transport system permease protein
MSGSGTVDARTTASIARKPLPVAVVLSVLLVAAVLASASIGAYAVPIDEVIGAVLRRMNLLSSAAADPVADEVIWVIRLPRIMLAVVVGAALGCAGAVMQGAFGNPLAEPGVVGVSSGAMLGAATQIVTGFDPLGVWTLPLAAFLGGLVAVAWVYLSSRHEGRTEVLTLILMGIALNALASAAIGFLAFVADDASLRSLTSWTLGSLAQATWGKVGVVAPVAVLGALGAISLARTLDLLSLGDHQARHLGVSVERARIRVLLVVALLAASAVAVSGVVLFVGLIVPHVVRAIVGPAHRAVLPLSVLLGAVVVTVADTVARTLVSPAELPLGVVTALVGAPVFIWQIRRLRRVHGAWA